MFLCCSRGCEPASLLCDEESRLLGVAAHVHLDGLEGPFTQLENGDFPWLWDSLPEGTM